MSVPESTSQHAAEQYARDLKEKTGRDVMVITHNIEFCEIIPASQASYDDYVKKLSAQ